MSRALAGRIFRGEEGAMEATKNDPFLRKVIDAYNNHRVEDFDSLLTDDCVMVRNGVEAKGRNAVGDVLRRLFRSIPDVHYEIDDVVVAGDKLALRWRGSGTSKGDYLGVPVTGKELRSEGITLYQLRDDKIARIWVSANVIGEPRVKPTQPEANA
jgi:steroid delta-isomerase-like uncharacterized protein